MLKDMYEECKKEMDETVCAGVGGCNFGVEVPASASVWVAPEFKPKKLNNNKLANPNFAKRVSKGKKSFSQGWGKEEKKKKVFESQSPIGQTFLQRAHFVMDWQIPDWPDGEYIIEYFKDCEVYQDFEDACKTYDAEGYDVMPFFKVEDGKLKLCVTNSANRACPIAMWNIEFNFDSYFWFSE